MTKKSTQSERVFHFHKATEFLIDYYRQRKNCTQKWSYEMWSRRLQIKKSTLIRMLKGTLLITEESEENFCKYFQFNSSQRRYFKTIVAAEKIEKNFPNIRIHFPEQDELRKQEHKMHAPSLPLEKIQFLSRPHVQWLLLLCAQEQEEAKIQANLNDLFHDGLQKIDFKTTLKTCLSYGLLTRSGKKLVYNSEKIKTIYLDAKMSNLNVAVERYFLILKNIREMITTDLNKGKTPTVGNSGASFCIKASAYLDLMNAIKKMTFDLMASFEDSGGDTVVDIQNFLLPIANRNEGFDFQTLIKKP